MRRIGSAVKRIRGDERGMEAVAAIFVLPFLFILIIGLIDVGWMIKTRMVVDNIISSTVKSAAAEGGDRNPQGPGGDGARAWSQVAMSQLWDGGKCIQSNCDRAPQVDCQLITRPNGTTYRSPVAEQRGHVITCTATYPYRPISGGLLRTPMGLGIGGLLKQFTVSESARTETGGY